MYGTDDSAHRFAAAGATIDELAWTRNDALKTRIWNVGVGPEVLKEFAGYLGSVGDPEGLIDIVKADGSQS